MKPEIRVGIGEASFRSPFFLRFGVGYSISSVREVIDVRLGFRPSRLLDGLVEIGQNEANAPSGRNMPRGGLENKSISKIERAGISLGLVKHMSQRVVSESVSDEDTAAAAEAVGIKPLKADAELDPVSLTDERKEAENEERM
ncbi:hypothetical protein VNO77_50926 [Canavalia gladiata]|uniref:Uncharacterized protein n=1 Tax=Canavalia gladiata TaxID=3824 RepID=A0AAN9PEG6_CANGL